jgi:small subunit ribosomal protein S16
LTVKMRLRRMGAKHQPSYRIVIADSRAARDGRYIDQVGFYNPLTNPAEIRINREKAVDWLHKGAQPTETVAILLNKFDIDIAAARKGQVPVAAGSWTASEEARQIAPEEAPNPEETAE